MNQPNLLSSLTFILGGARSGKSTLAENFALESGGTVLYVATARILDEEMRQRIRIHQSRRPKEWDTLEAPENIAQQIREHLQNHTYDIILLDCLAVYVSNNLMKLPDNTTEDNAWRSFSGELDQLIACVNHFSSSKWLIVSNEVGHGVVPAYPLGRLFRDVLGRTNQLIAQQAQTVYYMIAGIPMKIKPQGLDLA